MEEEKLILIGYSGHGFVAADIALKNDYNIIGYVDKNEKEFNPYELKYLGDENAIINNPIEEAFVFVSIGDNNLRKKILNQIIETYDITSIPVLISIYSLIASHCSIGRGTLIGNNVTINPLVDIGLGCIINTGSIIEHECKIGDFTHIAPGAVLAGNVNVGQLSFIGANSVIKQGITIGNNVTIGAGTVVLNNIPDNMTVVGNPGKIIK